MCDLVTAVQNYLARHQVMTLATTGTDGVWAAAVFYVHEGFTFYFLSAAHTRHAQHMVQQQQVAATVQEDYRDWLGIQGVQLSGTAVPVLPAEQERVVALYTAKYPFMVQPDPQIATALRKVKWYALYPDRLYFIDNHKGLGHRDAVPLTGLRGR